MFLLRQHKNCEHQLRRQHRLNKHPPRQTRIRTQRSPHIQRRRKHDTNKITTENTPRKLRHQQQEKPHRRHRLGEQHRKGNSRVEQTA